MGIFRGLVAFSGAFRYNRQASFQKGSACMLYYLLLLAAGALQGVMVSLNGQLGKYYSLFAICFFVQGICVYICCPSHIPRCYKKLACSCACTTPLSPLLDRRAEELCSTLCRGSYCKALPLSIHLPQVRCRAMCSMRNTRQGSSNDGRCDNRLLHRCAPQVCS